VSGVEIPQRDALRSRVESEGRRLERIEASGAMVWARNGPYVAGYDTKRDGRVEIPGKNSV
jgi:hypothetical protein